MLLGYTKPEIIIALLLLIATGFFPQEALPEFGALGGSVRAEDLLLAGLAVLLVFRGLTRMPLGRLPERQLYIALAAVLAIMLASAIRADIFLGVDKKAVLAELRTYFYLLPLVLIPLLLESEESARRLWNLLIAVILILALGQVMQALFDIPLLHGGRLEATVTLDKVYSGSMRSTVPGIYLIIFGFLYALGNLLQGCKSRVFWILTTGLCALAILLTYGRALWLVTALGLFILGLSFGVRKIILLSILGAFATAIILIGAASLKPTLLTAIEDRGASISSEIHGGSSLNWRYIENTYAYAKIEKAPIAGIGLGASYKPIVGGLDAWVEQTRFIHNGYLYLVLKTGVIGALVFAFFWISLLKIGWWHSRYSQGKLQLQGKVFLIVGMLPTITAFVRPEWADQGTFVVFATLGGILLARIHRRTSQDEQQVHVANDHKIYRSAT
jgi:O-antigen ligase